MGLLLEDPMFTSKIKDYLNLDLSTERKRECFTKMFDLETYWFDTLTTLLLYDTDPEANERYRRLTKICQEEDRTDKVKGLLETDDQDLAEALIILFTRDIGLVADRPLLSLGTKVKQLMSLLPSYSETTIRISLLLYRIYHSREIDYSLKELCTWSRKIDDLSVRIDELLTNCSAPAHKRLIYLRESLIRFQIEIDSVKTYGCEKIRSFRKEQIDRIDRVLTRLDKYLHSKSNAQG